MEVSRDFSKGKIAVHLPLYSSINGCSLKSRLENRELYTEEGLNHLAEELIQKLSLQSEKVHSHLMEELRILQENLSHLTDQEPQGRPFFQSRLALYVHRLRGIFCANVQDLRSHLQLYIHDLKTPMSQGEYQETTRWIGSMLHEPIQDLQPHLREFDTLASQVAENVRDSKEELHSGAEALQATVANMLGSTGSPREQLSQSIDRFCQSSLKQMEHFGSRIKQLLKGLEQGKVKELTQSQGMDPQHSMVVSLHGDFMTRLTTLLTDL
uniref:Uncharacterized protein n=1 Tax=Scleropages formosus TaxID=113540 RepID=A0A8C9W9C1_SCLFO